MASLIVKQVGKKKSYTIQLSPGENPKRPRIGLGICTKEEAGNAKRYIESLIQSQRTGSVLAPATAAWLRGVPPMFRDRLSDIGLCEQRIEKASEPKTPLVSAWLDAYIASRTDVKPGTRRRLNDVAVKMKAFFRNDRLDDVTVQTAKNFKIYLKTVVGLCENTARRHTGMARQFFHAAIDAELITKNPFVSKDLRVTVQPNEARFFYITPAMAEQVLRACPTIEWKLIFALARFGGLRCPTEILRLQWQDVNFEHNKFTVHSSKTEHHSGGGIRTVPLFPELRGLLLEAFEQADDGAVYVIAKTRDTAVNLRTHMMRIIRRAGLEVWPKLFQNLRSTRETELFRMTNGDIKSVCRWIGNSPSVALDHYYQTGEAEIQEAAKMTLLNQAESSVHKSVHTMAETTRKEPQEKKDDFSYDSDNPLNCGNLQEFSEPCKIPDNSYRLGRAGFESKAISNDNQRTYENQQNQGVHNNVHLDGKMPDDLVSVWSSLSDAQRRKLIEAIHRAPTK